MSSRISNGIKIQEAGLPPVPWNPNRQLSLLTPLDNLRLHLSNDHG